MKSLNLALVLMLVAGHSAVASEKVIVCFSKGKTLSRSGGELLNAAAQLTFVETTDASGARVLKNVEGYARTVGWYVANDGTSVDYIGNFKIAAITENVKFRPNKYKGYSQFQKFDATDTLNSTEDGMWGQLVVAKNTSRAIFHAHYIFQAGDHMGGTLHLSCKVQN